MGLQEEVEAWPLEQDWLAYWSKVESDWGKRRKKIQALFIPFLKREYIMNVDDPHPSFPIFSLTAGSGKVRPAS